MSLSRLRVSGARGGGGNAASGGSAASAASPEQWSADVCNATVGLQNAVRQQSIKLQQELGKATSVAEARQSILEFLDASVMLQDHMLDQLQAAGYPDVEHGGVIAVDLRTELAKVKPALQDARKKAAALPDDRQAFARGAAEIESNLTIASANLGRRAARLHTRGLQLARSSGGRCSMCLPVGSAGRGDREALRKGLSVQRYVGRIAHLVAVRASSGSSNHHLMQLDRALA